MATLKIDDEVYEALQLPEGEREDTVKKELAVSLYARDFLSFGKARYLAGLSKRDFHNLLSSGKTTRHYDEPELAEDIEYSEQSV